jgi:hypothetical protein
MLTPWMQAITLVLGVIMSILAGLGLLAFFGLLGPRLDEVFTASWFVCSRGTPVASLIGLPSGWCRLFLCGSPTWLAALRSCVR